MRLESLVDKWESFGWEVITVNGHDMKQLVQVLSGVSKVSGKPTLIIANTIKTKGISFAENVASWHHHVPTQEQYDLALKELEAMA
jgi:transketolase